MCNDGMPKFIFFFFFFFHHVGSERCVIREGLNFHPRCMNAWRWSKFSCKFQMTTEIGKKRGEGEKRQINCIDATTLDMWKRDKINVYDGSIGCNSSSGTMFPSNKANVTFRTHSEIIHKSHAGARYFIYVRRIRRVQPSVSLRPTNIH